MRFLSIRCNESLAVLAALLLFGSRLVAQEGEFDGTLRTGIVALAGQVHKDLANRIGVQSITVRPFSSPSHLAATAGAAIQKPLIDQLSELGVDCRDQNATTFCEGDYDFHQGDTRITIRVRVFHKAQLVSTHEQLVYSITDVCSLLGLSAQLPTSDLSDRSRRLAKRIWGQEIHLANNPGRTGRSDETLISATADGQFAIEVCVPDANGQFQAVPVVNDEGMAFVELPEDSIFALRVVNNASFNAAVNVMVDGLSMFAFDERPNYRADGRMIVAPGRGGALLTGWYVAKSRIVPFTASGYADSPSNSSSDQQVVLASDTTEFGTITASFATAIPRGTPLTEDEPWPRKPIKLYQTDGSSYFRSPLRVGLVREVVSVRFVKQTRNAIVGEAL